jgi:archaetidylinositol phosphate synthase
MGGLVRGGDGVVLNQYRSMADPFLNPLAKRLSGVSPDALTWIALLFSILAGLSFWLAGELSYHYLLLAFFAIILNALFDALDGWVARITGKASKRGDFLDHVLDRYADAFIVGGIVLSIYSHFTVGLLAILGVFFTSYMGTQSQALGLARDYGGILGRADRLVLLLMFTLGQWSFITVADHAYVVELDIGSELYAVTVLEILLIWFALAGHLTAVQRGWASWKGLTEQQDDEGAKEGSPSEGSEKQEDGSEDEAVTVEVVDDTPVGDGNGTEEGGGEIPPEGAE